MDIYPKTAEELATDYDLYIRDWIKFENFANPASIIWQSVETDYWKNFLEKSIVDFESKTSSKKAKKILENFDKELKNFKQVCPIEMLDKLENPISLKNRLSKAI